ncbi:hypothetical protein ASF32_16055 [Methylobacterium sp. Leaf91]|nr:hypothetical protein ASF24_10745 [Methylobacterium sp. Leaf86]KQO97951.1 hypothetical protein ASF32_16055 [Methylobacterium sp. Leaf91]
MKPERIDLPDLVLHSSLILRCRDSGLEGGLQIAGRPLETSFEAAAERRLLRMRFSGGPSAGPAVITHVESIPC